MKHLLNNYQSQWKQWWSTLSPLQKRIPVIAVAFWWISFWILGGMNADHLFTGSAALLSAYAGKKPRTLLNFLFPLLLTAVIYEAQQFFADYLRGEIRVREPYFFDKTFFGIETENGILTPNEWWQLHTHAVLDFITGVFYIIFIPVYLAFAAYYQFWLPRTGSRKMSGSEVGIRAPRIMWAFFWVNMIGYSTYYWYPAAPPWYVALHGLGPANLEVQANMAGCIRFDELIGIPVFSEWYGRSKDVFGAIPSLHVAYPLQIVFYAFQFGSARTLALIYWFLVSFGAVYLNHHYILDIIWGYAYAISVCLIIDGYYKNKESKRSQKEI